MRHGMLGIVSLCLAACLAAGAAGQDRKAREQRQRERQRAEEKRKQEKRRADRRKREQPKGKKPKGKKAGKPAVRKVAFSDEAVAESIRRGCGFLWKQQKREGNWEPHGRGGGRNYVAGPSALATYALLASGVSPLDERMGKALDSLSRRETNWTYVLGLRCNVWHLANRETRGKYLPQFRRDLRKLILFTKGGGYDYECKAGKGGRTDNSNSQYGVLGTWAGAMDNQEVPRQYWQLVLTHWMQGQIKDGGWSYQQKGASTATMTAGGIATLFVCFDNLLAGRFAKCEASTQFRPLNRGLAWMDGHFRPALGSQKLMGHGDVFYFLYGVERVGLASGYKYFGTSDWYKLGAEELLGQQKPDGSWKGKRTPLISTAFAILFLVRGQHAVAFNKLQYDGDWNNRPRDLASLTRWLSGSLERTLNWQIINLNVPTEQWHDAPILYLSGSKAPNLTDGQIDKLRRYVWQGGTIFSAAECNGRGFREGIRGVYEKLLPGRELKRLPANHDLYSIQHKLPDDPPLYEISNGVRPLVIHTDADLPRAWQLGLWRTSVRNFQTAGNVLMYVTDKGQLRHRGVSHWPGRPKGKTTRTVRLARVRYAGDWNPEPLAYERFARLLAARAKVRLERVGPVALGKLAAANARVAAMTGTEGFTLTQPQKAALKAYVQAGGTLILDAAGGSRTFAESAEAALREVFGRSALRRLATTAPLYEMPGMKIPSVHYRRKAKLHRGLKDTPNLRGVQIDGRIAVIFSKEDLTGGLLGTPSYACVGYRPDSCYELMRNALLYARKSK